MFCAVDIWGWTPNIMSLKFIFIALCHSSPHANPNDGNNQLSSIHMLLPLSCNLAATTSNRVLTIALNQGTDIKKKLFISRDAQSWNLDPSIPYSSAAR
jgi:hypothetical protein